jgi:MFS family permease
MVPARIAQAFAPFLFGLFIDHWGLGALWVSAALGVAAFAALLWLSDGLALQLRVPRVKDRV